jgi:hypothetical protein
MYEVRNENGLADSVEFDDLWVAVGMAALDQLRNEVTYLGEDPSYQIFDLPPDFVGEWTVKVTYTAPRGEKSEMVAITVSLF